MFDGARPQVRGPRLEDKRWPASENGHANLKTRPDRHPSSRGPAYGRGYRVLFAIDRAPERERSSESGYGLLDRDNRQAVLNWRVNEPDRLACWPRLSRS